MKVYLSGPISGLTPEQYTENFARAKSVVESEGWEPVNPIEVGACETQDCWEYHGTGKGFPTPGGGAPDTFLHHYSCYMKYDLKALLDCHAIALLPGWSRSKGANIELKVAEVCSMHIFHITNDYRELSRATRD